jgi:flagellar protein FliO/FliZ
MVGARSSESALLPIGLLRPRPPNGSQAPSLSRNPSFPRLIAAAATTATTALLCLPLAAFAADGEDTRLALEPTGGKAAESAGGTGSGLLRTIVGLAVVIGVIYGVTWILKSIKKAREAQASGTALDSLATLPLGPNRSLHLVRAGDVVVLLGVGENGVTPIRTYHEEEARALGLVAPEPLLGTGAAIAAGRPVLSGQVLPALTVGAGTARGSRIGKAVDGLRRRTVIR